MKVFGITGVIGSGKSSAVTHLRDLGYPTIDADQVSRLVVDRKTEAGKEGFEKIYKSFGASVLNNLGELDRGALRKRMMTNPTDRDNLEAILHPLIVAYIQKEMVKWKSSGAKLGFIEGSRLIESGFHNMLAGIVLVTAPEDQRLKRLMKRDSMGKDEVAMMLRLQDEGLMKRIARYTWLNDKTQPALKKTIEQFIGERLKDA